MSILSVAFYAFITLSLVEVHVATFCVYIYVAFYAFITLSLGEVHVATFCVYIICGFLCVYNIKFS